ncbi:hypothetical protein GUJ93_ZPchr0004g38362 [Zizania palustris]|uniref:Uncharacterized protein n=1 Tax=Zizania palustris TaxID=103762 RepID=A0A8J5SK09_ZIZPA|nr:hypothetical protein GUJ93_ZPchr0004g38362 [Zizania palustris]
MVQWLVVRIDMGLGCDGGRNSLKITVMRSGDEDLPAMRGGGGMAWLNNGEVVSMVSSDGGEDDGNNMD